MTVGILLRAAPGKLYVKLAELLRSRLRAGHWRPGERLPALDALARQFDVALVTVRQAVAVLEHEGLLQRRHGRGTFVSPQAAIREVWLHMDSDWDTLVRKWEGITPRILKVGDALARAPLHSSEGKAAPAYHYMRRVHASDGLPYAVIDLYLDQRIYDRAPRRFDSERVMPVLASLRGISIESARETITINAADVETASLLEIGLNAPVGLVRRVVRDASGVVVYLAQATYRGDVVRLNRTLSR